MSTKPRKTTTTQKFERALAAEQKERYLLRLYVTGVTPRSIRAIENIRALCEEHLHGRYELQVIDIYQKPALAKGDQIIATPTLIKKLPSPLRRLVGDLSDNERVLMGLDLRPFSEQGKRKSASQRPDGK